MNSPTVADTDKVERFLSATRAIKIWVDGGWGVDALLRRQCREHSDLDIIVASEDVETLTKLLESLCYIHVSRQNPLFAPKCREITAIPREPIF